MFQFHFGTIKSKNSGNPDRRLSEFQFHFGTIKSV